MAFEQYFSGDWKSTSEATDVEPENFKGGSFDCNICLELVREPVVTLCGHLFCWPCIYKWLHVQSASLPIDEPPQCPVCKAGISHTAMIPLYGRGMPEAEGKGMTRRGSAIPPRPTASNAYSLSGASHNTAQQLPYRNPYRDHNYNFDDSSGAQSQMFSVGAAGFHNSMFGEMVYARVFRNSDSLFGYLNPYSLRGSSSSPRLRRMEIQADKSLNRISIFLFCCFLLCLIVF